MNRNVLIFSVLLLPLAFAAASRAQTSGAATQPSSQSGDVIIPEANFQNTSLPEIVKFLREVSGENIILLAPSGADPSTVTFTGSFKHVTLKGILDVICSLPGYQISVDIQHGGSAKDIIVMTVNNVPHNADSDDTLVLVMTDPVAADLDDNKAKAALISSLISSALDAAQLRNPTLSLYYHPETGILIARGTPEQRRLLANLSDQLKVAQSRESFGGGGVGELNALHQQQEQLQRQVNQLHEELAKLKAAQVGAAAPANGK